MSALHRTFEHSKALTRMARRLAALKGRDPGSFSVEQVSDGSVCVRGPGATAFYPPDRWLGLFGRHLERGIFDP